MTINKASQEQVYGKQWWKTASRVIQTNLQVMDTPRMSAEQLAQNVVELEGNVLAVNVGGIYAWYQSEVLYHHIMSGCQKKGICWEIL